MTCSTIEIIPLVIYLDVILDIIKGRKINNLLAQNVGFPDLIMFVVALPGQMHWEHTITKYLIELTNQQVLNTQNGALPVVDFFSYPFREFSVRFAALS